MCFLWMLEYFQLFKNMNISKMTFFQLSLFVSRKISSTTLRKYQSPLNCYQIIRLSLNVSLSRLILYRKTFVMKWRVLFAQTYCTAWIFRKTCQRLQLTPLYFSTSLDFWCEFERQDCLLSSHWQHEWLTLIRKVILSFFQFPFLSVCKSKHF